MAEKEKAKINDREIVNLYQDPAQAVKAILEGRLTRESQEDLDANAIEYYNDNDPVLKHRENEKAANRLRFSGAILFSYWLINITLFSNQPQISSVESLNAQLNTLMTVVNFALTIGVFYVGLADYMTKTATEQDEEKATENHLTELYTQVLENQSEELTEPDLTQKQSEFAAAIKKSNWHRFEESLYMLLEHRAIPSLSAFVFLFMIYMMNQPGYNLGPNPEALKIEVVFSVLIIPFLTFFGSNILLGKLKQSYSRKITGLFEGEISQQKRKRSLSRLEDDVTFEDESSEITATYDEKPKRHKKR